MIIYMSDDRHYLGKIGKYKGYHIFYLHLVAHVVFSCQMSPITSLNMGGYEEFGGHFRLGNVWAIVPQLVSLVASNPSQSRSGYGCVK